MILKYWNNGAWGYIDNVRQTASKEIDPDVMVAAFDTDVAEGKRIALTQPADVDPLETKATKTYFRATAEFKEMLRGDVHSENLLSESRLAECNVAVVILLYMNSGEYETLILVTNQNTYLMNDKGQTIERLV